MEEALHQLSSTPSVDLLIYGQLLSYNASFGIQPVG